MVKRSNVLLFGFRMYWNGEKLNQKKYREMLYENLFFLNELKILTEDKYLHFNRTKLNSEKTQDLWGNLEKSIQHLKGIVGLFRVEVCVDFNSRQSFTCSKYKAFKVISNGKKNLMEESS